jgi:zinc/manganese transport system permease protein
VTWPEIIKTGVIYSLIGLVHWFLRDRFITISMKPADAKSRGWSVRGWDFLFYGLFGVVVTISVAIAGVLVVFSFLVIPAVIAFLFTTRPGYLLIIAWSSGILATLGGIYASYQTDLPTGPTVVCSFALTLALAFLLRRLIQPSPPALESS